MASVGEGWKEHVDQKTGRKYYANGKGETTWTHPLKEWDQRVDPKTGKTYYFHTKTKQTSWTLPKESGEWVGKIDQETGKTYFYNTITKATSWTDPSAAVSEADSDVASRKLAERYASYEFREYAEKHFQLNRKGLMKGKSDLDKMLRWKSEQIKTGLLEGSRNADAAQLFRNVTGYMGDRPGTSKAPIEHCLKILANVLLGDREELSRRSDELYCQLVKQLTENPERESVEKGWELMAASLSTFPPSEELAPYLGHFCCQNPYCLNALAKICDLGPRKRLPTRQELEATLRRAKTILRLSIVFDENVTTLKVDAWTTASECCATIAARRGLRRSSAATTPFALYDRENERFLDEEDRVLDHSSLLQFKMRYCFSDVAEENEAEIELTFLQAKYDVVVRGRYPHSEQDAVHLAALQMQEELGDYESLSEERRRQIFSKDEVRKYLAEKYVDALGDEEELTKSYAELAGYTKTEARRIYLDYVRAWKLYGSDYYRAEPKQNADLPKRVLLAVNAKGILVVDPEGGSMDVLHEYSYSNIVTWGHSSTSFLVVTGTANDPTKAHFHTDQGRDINLAVRTYVQRITSSSHQKRSNNTQ